MLSFLNPWKLGTIGAGILLALALGWGFRANGLKEHWEAKYATLDGQTQTVLIATRQATDNPKLTWPAVPDQITALAASNQALKASITDTNVKVTAMATQTAALKAQGDALRSQVAQVQQQRAQDLARLDAMASKPTAGTDCAPKLQAANAALDLARETGL